MKLPGVISLRNDLPDLADAEGQLPPHGLKDVVEIDEDALGGLRAQVGDRRVLLDRAHERLEHQVELTRRLSAPPCRSRGTVCGAPQWPHASRRGS